MKACPFFRFVLGCVLALAASPCMAEPATRYVLEDIEVYGGAEVKPEDIRKLHGERIELYLRKRGYRSALAAREAKRIREELVAGVRSMGKSVWASLEEVKLRQENGATYVLLLFEVVAKEDLARRLPFRPRPKASVADPSGLLDAYASYVALGKSLVEKNQIKNERSHCPALYCTYGSATPELAKLENKFVEEVSGTKDLLVRIMEGDRDPSRRARAVFLLSYLADRVEVTRVILSALKDSEPAVREAAVQVLNDAAVYHAEIPVPVQEAMRLLDYPTSSDRTIALGLLLSVADNPQYRPFMLNVASEKLLALLRSKHPNNHDMAHTVLGLLSGETMDSRNYAGWDQWLKLSRRAAAEASGKKE